MKNFVHNGKVAEISAAATILSGQVVALGKLVGVAIADAAVGDKVNIAIEGVFSLPVKAGVTIVAGDKIYLIAAESVVTNVVGTNVPCGFAETGGTVKVDVILR